MSAHHSGAIQMADEAWRESGSLRLRLMSHAIRHSQRGEIELMHRTRGFEAVRRAILSLFLPAGQAHAEQHVTSAPAHRP